MKHLCVILHHTLLFLSDTTLVSSVSSCTRSYIPITPLHLEENVPLVVRGGAVAYKRTLAASSLTSTQKEPAKSVHTKSTAATATGGGASMTASVFNLVNNVAGAGLLTLAAGKATAGVGWIPAIIIAVTLATLSAHTFTLIGKACDITGEQNFAVS